jgi:hypothetical protein
MADTDIDAVRKKKKAEYDKQHRLKRKLLKRHLIHKSSYVSGEIKKSTVKQWLTYLLMKQLYRNVAVNNEFFKQSEALRKHICGSGL